ncbi:MULTISPECIES: WecB/TagA/CpsF family glycosyltransferase [unclassified Sphingobium]|uniref:WecB/TagA/CpsF family glycosyltransferase n=1 Tax=unclassified Sphingobium TaxID=2611147 RepID=UPI0022258FC1|nr:MULTISPECIES: WecB/TagA/CpsF family glycosyltransferase [unclassified Sphingobium]MCW2412143.1 exopolysaccharide biosynthesis WecB/TagA/CpsF family protein [Sphingobium sp. B8D3D]MCW2415560.1 exopolysaccharide biosynthesis WecB/TagA/CpsF family protein [Sphingobium sp. B8D3A]
MTDIRTIQRSNGQTWRKVRLLNIWLDDLSVEEIVANLDDDVLFTANVDHLYQLQRNAAFREAYSAATVISCDSKYVKAGVVFTGRGPMKKACGSDIVPAYWRHHADNPDVTMFLLGAKPGVAQAAQERINRLAGRQIVVGAHGPSMNFVDDPAECDAAIDMINRSGATCLVVGLGAPKQEIWISRHKHRMPGVKLFMGVGATIDYEAQVVKRAPVWMRKLGLEWFHRVVSDPRRYAMRYARNLEFFWLITKDRLGRYNGPGIGGRDDQSTAG